jgi:hypothetical protein
MTAPANSSSSKEPEPTGTETAGPSGSNGTPRPSADHDRSNGSDPEEDAPGEPSSEKPSSNAPSEEGFDGESGSPSGSDAFGVGLHREDIAALRGIAERHPEPLRIQDLIRIGLPSLIRRIKGGDYDPQVLLTTVGRIQRQHQRRIEIALIGDITWEDLEEVAQVVRADLDLALLNMKEEAFREGEVAESLRGWTGRACTSKTLLRAAAREIALQRDVMSEDMTYPARVLREQVRAEGNRRAPEPENGDEGEEEKGTSDT